MPTVSSQDSRNIHQLVLNFMIFNLISINKLIQNQEVFII